MNSAQNVTDIEIVFTSSEKKEEKIYFKLKKDKQKCVYDGANMRLRVYATNQQPCPKEENIKKLVENIENNKRKWGYEINMSKEVTNETRINGHIKIKTEVHILNKKVYSKINGKQTNIN